MTTVRFEAVEVPGRGWSLRIPGVVDQLQVDGREVWRDRGNAETAARLWLAEFRRVWNESLAQALPHEDAAIRVAARLLILPEQARAILEMYNWFDDADEPEPVDEVEPPQSSPYSEDGDWVALTVAMEHPETGRPVPAERWIAAASVRSMWSTNSAVTAIEMDQGRALVMLAPIAEVAAALGLVARDCRHVGTPTGEE